MNWLFCIKYILKISGCVSVCACVCMWVCVCVCNTVSQVLTSASTSTSCLSVGVCWDRDLPRLLNTFCVRRQGACAECISSQNNTELGDRCPGLGSPLWGRGELEASLAGPLRPHLCVSPSASWCEYVPSQQPCELELFVHPFHRSAEGSTRVLAECLWRASWQ